MFAVVLPANQSLGDKREEADTGRQNRSRARAPTSATKTSMALELIFSIQYDLNLLVCSVRSRYCEEVSCRRLVLVNYSVLICVILNIQMCAFVHAFL